VDLDDEWIETKDSLHDRQGARELVEVFVCRWFARAKNGEYCII
jgi:hypothetical protein